MYNARRGRHHLRTEYHFGGLRHCTGYEKPVIFQLGDCLTSGPNVAVGSTYELSIDVIAQGDTFAKIAKRFQIKLRDLEIMNPNLNPARLKVGQPILVHERQKD
jgi:LysM repeat protein